MNSALIITGNLRSFDDCFKTFEELIDLLDCDIFICISNIQFDLHPYIKSNINFYSDCNLSYDLIKKKFEISTKISSKIKKIFLLDKIEENNTFVKSYLSKFDRKKSWIGSDIFQQYNKFNYCIDYIKEFEINNNIKYNYIIKTRFDINIDINSLPQYPVIENTIYSTNYNNSEINDIFLLTNSIENFNVICKEIQNHFFYNIVENLDIYQSIHKMLFYIFKSNNLISIQNIISSVNRNYLNYFDTNITLVTCFYNINRENWKTFTRSTDVYFKKVENLFNKKNPIVIFTTENYVNKCIEIRKKTDTFLIYTKIIVIPFEELMYYDKIDKIREIQQNNIINIPNDSRDCPEFCIPEYIILINNKLNFIKKVADENIFNSSIFQWVDFGLHTNLFKNNNKFFDENYFSNIFYKKDKIKIVCFENPKKINDISKFYNSHLLTVSAALIGGDFNAINKFYNLCNNEFECMINNKLMNQEQYIYYYLLCNEPSFFDYSLMNNWDDLCESYFKNNTKIAICMSGNIRTFNLCNENIHNNIIQPLLNSGCQINTFLSTWNDDDYTNNLDIINNFFTQIEVENYNNDFFTNNYSTTQYLNYPGLCCSTTSSNASSMHYKIKKVYELAKKYTEINNIDYDIIIRIRPDIIYNNQIDLGNIKSSLLNNYLYMPNSHGKYTSVTKNIMDHFFYGNISCMKIAMNTFDNIKQYLETDHPHTGEGFLNKNISENNIIINRFICSYGVIRKHSGYEIIYN
jgi:protein YibB